MLLKSKRRGLQPRGLTLAVAAALMQGMQPAWADAPPPPAPNQLPTGGSIVGGPASGTITVNGTVMRIDQYVERMIGRFDCFCIGSAATVNVLQPNSYSTALFSSAQAAQIFGKLNANGNVFITSQPGIYFGPNAQVNAHGFLASTLSINEADFLAGNYKFFNPGNSGKVHVAPGATITVGGYAALAGPQVMNEGIIVANAGSVTLAAGDRVSLDMVGDGLIRVSVDAAALNALALNAGTIQADGGRVVLTARSANALLDTVVNNTGVIRARSLVERNGEIVLDGGSAGVVANGGALDASGRDAGTTGGTVSVGGQHVYMTEGSSIDASGVAGGGTVTVKGSDTAYVYGGIDARGTGEGASGGFVETSGHYLEVGQAPSVGAGGTWLIDPYNIEVVGGAGTSNNAGQPTFTPTGDSSQIGNTLIIGQLNAGANVVLDTGGAGSPGMQAGDITVNATITKTAVNSASLTLNAFHDVNLNANVVNQGGAVTVSAGGSLNLNAAGAIDVTLTGASQSITAQAMNLNARDGRRATVANTGGDQNINIGAGGINLNVLNGNGVAQVFTLAAGTQNVSTTGALNVQGGATTGSTNSGVFTSAGGVTQNVTAASITLQGANSGVTNGGALINNVPATGTAGDQNINVAGGNITLIGGAAGSNNRAAIAGGSNQTIAAANLVLTSGAGTDASATVTAPNQVITVSNDVLVSGGAGGGPVNGSRIGGLGGAAPSATNLTLHVGRDLQVSGGTGVGASIGSTVTAGTPQTINIDAGRDVILAAGTGGGVRIGTPGAFAPAPGDISISAQRDIQMNANGAQGASIRTAGNVSLSAGGSISQNQANAAITAAQLTASSTGNTSLIGDNRLGSFTGTTTLGNLSLHNVQSLTVAGPVSSAGTVDLDVDGTLTLDASTQDAIVTSRGGQTATADAIVMSAQAGHRAILQNLVSGNQEVSATAGGIEMNVVGGAGVAQIINNTAGSSQTVTSSGLLHVVGGSGSGSTNSGLFVIGGGAQTVVAGSIELQGALAGNNGAAVIVNTQNGGGDQHITVNGGSIRLTGGASGLANRAVIATNGNQTIDGNPDIFVTGGSSGNGAGNQGNAALIAANVAGKTQTINAGNIALTSGSGGRDTSATITSGKQSITATGDVVITGSNGNFGDSNGTRIGGVGGTPAGATDIVLNVGRDLILNGGGADSSGASIGSSNVAPAPGNTIAITAGRDVVLNGGTAAGARIGSGSAATGPGDISVSAGRDIRLNGAGSGASIRTTGTVTLNAGGNITENQANAAITAAQLTTSSTGNTSLIGDNRLGSFSGTSTTGSLTLHNAQGLTINGPVSGATTVDLDVDGALTLDASTQDAIVTSHSGQTVTADSIAMNAQAGHRAILQNVGTGDQTISATAGGIDMNVVGGAGVAQIVNATTPGGNQTVSASGTLHIAGGIATPQPGSTNSGIFLSSGGGGLQSVSAGALAMEGANNGLANSGALISTAQNDQSVNVAGDITIAGGSVGNSGIFGAAGRNQDISAHDIRLTNSADTATSNNSGAFILGGRQHINASGDVTLTSRASGGTLAGIRIGSVSGGTDLTLNVGGNLVLTGGTAPNNGVGLGSSAAGTAQPNDITVTVGGDVILNGGGAAGSGARIGSANNGVAGGNIAISARDIQLNGGVAPAVIRTADNVTLNANGSIVENGNAFVEAGSLTTISSGDQTLTGPNQVASFNGTSGGDLAFVNTGALDVTGVSAAGNASVANSGAVTLSGLWSSATASISGTTIAETGSGAVQAGALTTSSTGATTLSGPNQVASFSGASTAGDVSLRNTSALLTLGNMDLPGSLAIDQTGALSVPGTVSALNQSIQATGDVTIGGASGGFAGLFADNAMTIRTPQSIIIRGSDTSFAGASLVVGGGLVTLDAGEVRLTGGAAPLAAAAVLGGELNVTSAGNIYVVSGAGWQADALLYSRNDITMTIGGNLNIDGRPGANSWARVQTERRDGTITLNFPNAHSGHFFVDGVQGKVTKGDDGFFAGDKAAKLGRTLFLNYGL